jgi:hypothetical protein
MMIRQWSGVEANEDEWEMLCWHDARLGFGHSIYSELIWTADWFAISFILYYILDVRIILKGSYKIK